jgi:hypothetical protein
MLFEARELKSYAEPVSTTSLREGHVYFSVQYADDSLCVPLIETLVFAGRSLDGGDADLLYFQDVESYRQGIRHGSPEAENAKFQSGREGKINHIFEYEDALNELMKCSLRRGKSASGPP